MKQGGSNRSRRIRGAVVDASAVVDLLSNPQAESPLKRLIEDPHVELHVPMLCDVEVAAALRRALRRDLMDFQAVTEKLARYLELRLSRYQHEPILERALQLHQSFTVYDAIYVALAEVLGVSLLTTDAGLGRAVRAHTSVPLI